MAAKPLLEKQRRAIVNIASVWSFFGGGLVPAYTASKGGVAQLTKALAVAWAPTIRVNAIAPGWIETELTKAAQADAARSEAIVSRTPFGRWGKPDDIGGAAVFLCSEAARLHHRHGAAGGWRLYGEIGQKKHGPGQFPHSLSPSPAQRVAARTGDPFGHSRGRTHLGAAGARMSGSGLCACAPRAAIG